MKIIPNPMVKIIMVIVLDYFNLTIKELRLRTKKPKYSHPRMIAIYMLYRYTNLQPKEIKLLLNVNGSPSLYSNIIKGDIEVKTKVGKQALDIKFKFLNKLLCIPNDNKKIDLKIQI